MCTLYVNDEEIGKNVVSVDVRLPENVINNNLVIAVQFVGFVLLTF